MKKNLKPLTYCVHPSLAETDKIKEYIEKGHTVIVDEAMVKADLIIGPNCYRLSEQTIDLLDLATKAERASKYPTKKKESVNE